ncbi:MAG: mycofactocin-coupled SDR family oxidoreductase [Actinomycetota bacterium]|nr:mycofactocin-coupled SDR family oxidoreductase [Actinomycetota bacterium]
MGLLDGKVAFITGAARAQGRSHAVRFAEEGADIIALDICAPPAAVGYVTATPEDMQETARQVEALGRKIVARVGDVRDQSALDGAVADGVAALGRLDIVVANAGISSWGRFWEMSEERWQAMIDINLTGVWRTLRATAPTMIAQGTGGSMITISSVAGIKSLPGQAHYSAAKHGVVGLTKTAAIELGPHEIRVNSVHPWGVQTPMAEDAELVPVLAAYPEFLNSFGSIMPQLGSAAPRDISEVVLFLASDASRFMTGAQIPVDMGATKV